MNRMMQRLNIGRECPLTPALSPADGGEGELFLAGFPRVALCESRNPGLDDAIPSGLISGLAVAVQGGGSWEPPIPISQPSEPRFCATR